MFYSLSYIEFFWSTNIIMSEEFRFYNCNLNQNMIYIWFTKQYFTDMVHYHKPFTHFSWSVIVMYLFALCTISMILFLHYLQFNKCINLDALTLHVSSFQFNFGWSFVIWFHLRIIILFKKKSIFTRNCV